MPEYLNIKSRAILTDGKIFIGDHEWVYPNEYINQVAEKGWRAVEFGDNYIEFEKTITKEALKGVEEFHVIFEMEDDEFEEWLNA